MIKKELMIAAHKMTKEIKAEFPEINYSFQLGLCISHLLENKGEVAMVELKGSEKQIAWAEKIRVNMLEGMRILDTFKSNDKIISSPTAMVAVKALEILKNEIETQESAKWFIDNRRLVTGCTPCGYSKEMQILSAQFIVYDSKDITKLLNLEDKYYNVICKMKAKVEIEFAELYR